MLIDYRSDRTPQASPGHGVGATVRAGDANLTGVLMRAVIPFAAAMTAVGLYCTMLFGQARAATILVYHSFGVRSSMSMSVEAFESQLDFLDRSGYKVISMDELAKCLDAHQSPPEHAVVIAIDDGWATVMRAFPVLARRNLPFTLFLPMAYIANPGSTATLGQADIDALRAYPRVTFANHSWSHSPRLARDEAFAREDIRKSLERYRQIFGKDTKYFAYPYGRTSEAYTRLLREAGFEYLFVTGDDPATADTPKTAIPRIAANRLSLPVLASVLQQHEAFLARANKAKTAPAVVGELATEAGPDRPGPRLME